MMMGETAALLKDFFTAFIFNLLINVDNLVSRDVSIGIVVTEVDIDCCSSFIELGYSEGYKEAILFDASIFTSLDKSLTDV
jgi:hypothetical protein